MADPDAFDRGSRFGCAIAATGSDGDSASFDRSTERRFRNTGRYKGTMRGEGLSLSLPLTLPGA